MRVVVLGSGIIGTSSAWWLRQSGHDVTVIDRQPGPAQETSFANGCQISVSYAEPWANPQAPLKLARWLLQGDAPLLFRLHADWHQWLWCMAFLRECLPGRLPRNVRALVNMAAYSRQTLQAMRAELGIPYDHLEKGIINFYRDPAEFDASQKAADLMREYGVDRRILSTEELVALEPALAPQSHRIVGADYTAADESGDVYQFTTALAAKAAAAGVEFRFSTQATRLLDEGGWVKAVETIDAHGRYAKVQGDVFVAALGSFTPDLVRPLGVPFADNVAFTLVNGVVNVIIAGAVLAPLGCFALACLAVRARCRHLIGGLPRRGVADADADADAAAGQNDGVAAGEWPPPLTAVEVGAIGRCSLCLSGSLPC